MKKLLLALLFSTVAWSGGQAAPADRASAPEKVVVAYVTAWSEVMPDPCALTHINYAFGHVDSTFQGIRISNPDRLRAIAGLKARWPGLKVLLSVGGWGSGNFSEMAATEENRRGFAAACRDTLAAYGLDGIDIDWEYPGTGVAGISCSAEDEPNFVLMMQAIREAIGPDKLLTLATPANGKRFPLAAIVPYIDFVNIMGYDIAYPPYHHAGLFRSGYTYDISVDEGVTAHLEAGVPAEKLVLGLPFYGRFAKGSEMRGSYGSLRALKGYRRKWDRWAKAPYLAGKGGTFVCSYENPRSIRRKGKYIRERGLRGAMYWQYASDDARGTLRKAVRRAVR